VAEQQTRKEKRRRHRAKIARKIYSLVDDVREEQREEACRGNWDALFDYRVVCVVDILGQKSALEAWGELPNDITRDDPRFLKCASFTAGTVSWVHRLFVQIFKEFETTPPPAIAAGSQEMIEAYFRLIDCVIHVDRLSDMFVFSSPLKNLHADLSPVPLMRMVGTACEAMFVSLSQGIPLRGAIVIGRGGLLTVDPADKPAFYGPALAAAYSMEHYEADYPRILVSPSVEAFVPHSDDVRLNSTMLEIGRAWRPLIDRDRDGKLIVDYLGDGAAKMARHLPRKQMQAWLAYSFAKGRREEFSRKSQKDPKALKLARKYHRLQNYLEPRLSLWGVRRA
jgi:hypothetical protein